MPSKIAELLIVGTGPVARALVSIAEASGFHVRVAAGPDSPSVGAFDGADEVIVTPTPESVEALRPGADTFVVLCSDDKEFSGPVIRSFASTPVPYIGVVGNSGRFSIYESHSADSKIHWPAGIRIGAETAEELAISILAEVVAIRRGVSTAVPRES